MKTTPDDNKALVLEAFDALFNKRDYEAAAHFWSDTYIQHSAHIKPGRDGLFDLIRSSPATLRYEPGTIVAEGDYVIVHGRFSGTGRPGIGSPPISSVWPMVCSLNTGTFCRTKQQRPSRGAVCRCSGANFPAEYRPIASKEFLMRQLQLMAFGEPLDVIQLNTFAEPALGPEDVLVSMEAAPLNPSDFLLVRGIYGVRPPLPFSLGAEGVGRVTKTGSKVNTALLGKRVMIVPNYEQGTWSDEVVVRARNTVPVADDADPLQLAMIGINPATAYLLLHRYISLMPGDWIGQTAANSAMGQYTIALARLAGVKTLNVVRRPDAVEKVRQFGGDRVVLQGDNLRDDINKALGGKKLSLVLDSLGGSPVGELARSLKPGGSIAAYAFKLGLPVLSPEFLYNNLNLHGFWIGNWMRNAPSTEIQELYQKLADLVADGSLSAAVEQVYPLDKFKQAIDRSLKSSRNGKILFKFDAS